MGLYLVDHDVWTIVLEHTGCGIDVVTDIDSGYVYQVPRHGDIAGAFLASKQLRIVLKAALNTLTRRNLDAWISSNVCEIADWA